ncbi:MAG: hypothetical protein HY696_00395 [Deltaproteobacteria bacterium]|nr:hypothetical protein [Deltaproteobacteria bacterium]
MKIMAVSMPFMMLLSLVGLSGCTGSASTGSDGTSETAVAENSILSHAPSLTIDFASTNIAPSLSPTLKTKKAASTIGDLSVGGCLAWSIRKNAKYYTSALQYLKCLYSAASQAGLIDLEEGETVFLNLELPGATLPTKISESNGLVTISVCYNDSPTENIRYTLQESGSGYLVTGTSLIENGSGAGTYVYSDVTVDTSTASVEEYLFTNHVTNETSASLCSGAGGTSLTEDDSTCFLRIEGRLTNDATSSDNPFSMLSGVFSEKNSAGVRTTASAYSKFMGGIGATLFSAGLPDVNSDVNGSTALDSWGAADFVTTTDAGFASTVSAQTLVSRTATLPSIDSAWDCQATGPTVSLSLANFQSAIESLRCAGETLNSADMTNCTGGTTELTEVVDGYLCDTNDPLIDTASRNCS